MGSNRFLEWDILRGLAVVFMVLYHFIFDIHFFVQPILDFNTGIWFWVGRITAFSFVFGAGAVTFLYAQKRKEAKTLFPVLLGRGSFLFSLGLLITFVTFVLFPHYAIWFGILHFLGLSTILSYFFLERKIVSLLAGIIVFITGIYGSIVMNFFPKWMVLFPFSFPTFDYFPLFPWFGIFLLGVWVGQTFYVSQKSNPTKKINPFFILLAKLGQKSLLIYLIHQPILVGIIFLAKYLTIAG